MNIEEIINNHKFFLDKKNGYVIDANDNGSREDFVEDLQSLLKQKSDKDYTMLLSKFVEQGKKLEEAQQENVRLKYRLQQSEKEAFYEGFEYGTASHFSLEEAYEYYKSKKDESRG